MGIYAGGQLVMIDTTMGFSMPIIEKILEGIIEKGAPEEIALGYNRKKYDLIVARKKEYVQSCGG
jgi:hypothetical protein